MTKLVTINNECEHDDEKYKKQMFEKEKNMQITINNRVKEKNAFSDKIYNETIQLENTGNFIFLNSKERTKLLLIIVLEILRAR
jgi:hypothetical protein